MNIYLIIKKKIFINCTADIGWVTGHSYIIYGPLSNGATTLMFEGVPKLSKLFKILGNYR